MDREGSYCAAEDPDVRTGWLGPLDFPRIQGADVAGTVVTCGDGAAAGLIGARVLVDLAEYDGPGPDARPADVLRSERNEGFAEYVVVPSARAHSVDGSPLTDVELAALPIAYGTVLAVLDRGSVSMTATGRRATTLLPDPSGEPRGCRTRM